MFIMIRVQSLPYHVELIIPYRGYTTWAIPLLVYFSGGFMSMARGAPPNGTTAAVCKGL